MKFIIMQFSPRSVFLPFRSKGRGTKFHPNLEKWLSSYTTKMIRTWCATVWFSYIVYPYITGDDGVCMGRTWLLI
jgi:hypothetical protein